MIENEMHLVIWLSFISREEKKNSHKTQMTCCVYGESAVTESIYVICSLGSEVEIVICKIRNFLSGTQLLMKMIIKNNYGVVKDTPYI